VAARRPAAARTTRSRDLVNGQLDQLLTKTWATSAKRTLDIRVLGTTGRPRVDVDGFWVGS
jgi:hypothetical protein